MKAIWNRTRSLAETAPVTPHRAAMLARMERNAADRERGKIEHTQLDWRPARGRIPYAGREK